ncbi:unnamed protein product [Parajaminaea phylloscopi]
MSQRIATSVSVLRRSVVALTLPEAYHLSLVHSRKTFATSCSLRRHAKTNRSRSGFQQDPQASSRYAAPSSSSSLYRPNRVPRFPQAAKIPRSVAARHLNGTLQEVCQDQYVLSRLQSLGLRGDIVEALTKRIGELPVPCDEGDELDPLRHLLRIWASERQEQIASELESNIGPEGMPLINMGLHAISGEQRKDQVESRDLRNSQSLRRMHVTAFLDWTQRQLEGIVNEACDGPAAIKAASTLLVSLRTVRKHVQLEIPSAMYPYARFMKRQIHLHVGPTNSGKTHGALVRLVSAHSGVYLGPLRLLAHEIWDRINRGRVSPGVPARLCNLKTGEEERTLGEYVALVSATVEMAPLEHIYDVAVIDEIQMIADPQRGSAWTSAVLGMAAKELHLCGEDVVIPLIEKLAKECGDELTIHRYQRLTPLHVAEKSIEGDLSQIRPGDCVVSFSRQSIFALKERIDGTKTSDGTTLRCAIAYGNLPPEVKAEQARLFNEGTTYNVMVASDAIGMGLNLRIKRIIFESLYKFNGTEDVVMSAAQIKQIAGRAGRYGTTREGGEDGGVVTCMREEDMDILREALAVPNKEIRRAAIQPPATDIDELSKSLPPVEQKSMAEVERAFHEHQQRRRSRVRQPLNNDSRTLQCLESAHNALMLDAAGDEQVEEQELAFTRAARADVRLSNVYTDIGFLATLNLRNYFLSDLNQQSTIAPLVRRASCLPTTPSDEADASFVLPSQAGYKTQSSLTVEELELFATSPANTRDGKLMGCLALFIRQYSRGKIVDFSDAIAKIGLKAAVDTADATYEELMAAWKAQRSEKGDGEGDLVEPTLQQLAMLTSSKPAIDAFLLKDLETMHSAVTLYLWLASRFPLAFSQRGAVHSFKDRTERAVELSLEVLRTARNKRLAELGRSTGADARAEKEQRRRQNRQTFKGKGGQNFGRHRDDPKQQQQRDWVSFDNTRSTTADAVASRGW